MLQCQRNIEMNERISGKMLFFSFLIITIQQQCFLFIAACIVIAVYENTVPVQAGSDLFVQTLLLFGKKMVERFK